MAAFQTYTQRHIEKYQTMKKLEKYKDNHDICNSKAYT